MPLNSNTGVMKSTLGKAPRGLGSRPSVCGYGQIMSCLELHVSLPLNGMILSYRVIPNDIGVDTCLSKLT